LLFLCFVLRLQVFCFGMLRLERSCMVYMLRRIRLLVIHRGRSQRGDLTRLLGCAGTNGMLGCLLVVRLLLVCRSVCRVRCVGVSSHALRLC
jgi:Lon protease-like protein